MEFPQKLGLGLKIISNKDFKPINMVLNYWVGTEIKSR
jgi:hypothetical protein